ncbi:MAG TPA: SMC-Scp complex subunit ScpB [Armatimonadetes bacterium]|nr:SMC-Scp complex subunit ScpB [Armatimonadota bacterium]
MNPELPLDPAQEFAERVRAVECLLFATDRPISQERLGQVLGCSPEEIAAALECLRKWLAGHGLQVLEVAGGFRLTTRPEYAEYVERLLAPPPVHLSPASLETLAIIAYRQPITRPEIDALRGVNSQQVLRNLLEHGLIEVRGRKRVPGRPLLYGTTPRFLELFGLRDLSDLPRLGEEV